MRLEALEIGASEENKWLVASVPNRMKETQPVGKIRLLFMGDASHIRHLT